MKIAILGFGLEGKSTFKFLTTKKSVSISQITILDENHEVIVPDGVHGVLGPTCYDSLHEFDVIRKTPGITNHLLELKLGSKEAYNDIYPKLTSQIQYFFDTYIGFTIGITGTKGKSQTSTVCYRTLKNAGLDVELIGNIGIPTLDVIDFTNPPEYVVYEISSFMLDSLNEFTLDIGIFITLFAAHTIEHGSFHKYVLEKLTLLKNSKLGFIGHQAFETLQEFDSSTNLSLDSFIIFGEYGDYMFTDGEPCGVFYSNGEAQFTDKKMLIPGVHNKTNICCILGVLDTLKIPNSHLEEVLSTFTGLDYRTQDIGVFHGIKRINDAIATTPQATEAAIDTFGEDIDTLLYGGIDGEYDHSGVVERILSYKIKNLILFPDSGKYIKASLEGTNINIFETRDMQEAVRFSIKNTENGKTVLLSCGSPSFSCWKSYKEKGDLFNMYIQKR